MGHEEPTPEQLRAVYRAVEDWLDSLETVLDTFAALGLSAQVDIVANLHGSLGSAIDLAMEEASA
ncbi:hypothetical protein SEA_WILLIAMBOONE_62 [Gordonia phage WilliamBoone]|nr:hypothetical protein SEA_WILLIAMBOONE_62 [Gordonia phage WilliamBoone]